MNKTTWDAHSVGMTPVCLVDRATGIESRPKDLFQLQFPAQSGQILTPSDLAHIPELMQSYFREGVVRQITLEVLPSGRLATRLLPGSPNALVCSIVTDDGECITATPTRLRVARKYY